MPHNETLGKTAMIGNMLLGLYEEFIFFFFFSFYPPADGEK